MRAVKLIAGVVLPWTLVIGGGIYEIIRNVDLRHSDRELVKRVQRQYETSVIDAHVVETIGPLTVLSCRTYDAEEFLLVERRGIRIASIWHTPTRAESLVASIYVDGAPFVDCATDTPDKFPTNLVVFPKNGVNGHFAMYGDYNLDGVFERKKVFDNIAESQPAPVDPELLPSLEP